jgi:site-specific DNA recombinase
MPAMRLRPVSHLDAHLPKGKLYYYRCIGSDAYRHLRGALCHNRPVRQDYLDQFVWREIIRLLEDPALVQAEIARRMEEARNADPLRRRQQHLRQQQTRLQNGIERLLTAYQEQLLSLDQLRQRMPTLCAGSSRPSTPSCNRSSLPRPTSRATCG